MLTIKEAIDNFNYLKDTYGEDTPVFMDWHIPANYGMTNGQFRKAVNQIDPDYDIYEFVEEKFRDLSSATDVNYKTLEFIADTLENHPRLHSISEAIRRVI